MSEVGKEKDTNVELLAVEPFGIWIEQKEWFAPGEPEVKTVSFRPFSQIRLLVPMK